MYNLVHISLLISSLGVYSAYMLLDDKLPEEDPRNKMIEWTWHAVGAIVFAFLAYTFSRFIGWKYAFFVLSQFWLLFAGIIHTVALKKPFFFVGTTAATDKIIQRTAVLVRLSPLLTSAILKITALILSVLIILKS